ncbi:putative quinol monooxygenase [Deinococcus sp.]|uniref:putative quinol monooxygenase n=1 Tax=Deinococcus sp. TaxID=47478 RepID=UPI0025BB5A73|nr:putative quinol monooxygenase [Deinococcus sp.]
MSPLSVHAILTPHADKVAQTEAELRKVVQGSRQEPGNLRYDLSREDSPAGIRFHISERYRDEAAVEAHRATAHYQAYRAAAPDLLSRAPEVSVLEEIDVVG